MEIAVTQEVADRQLIFSHLCQHPPNRRPKGVQVHAEDANFRKRGLDFIFDNGGKVIWDRRSDKEFASGFGCLLARVGARAIASLEAAGAALTLGQRRFAGLPARIGAGVINFS